MTTMIKQRTKFPLLLDPLGKPDHQAIHCPTANIQNPPILNVVL